MLAMPAFIKKQAARLWQQAAEPSMAEALHIRSC